MCKALAKSATPPKKKKKKKKEEECPKDSLKELHVQDFSKISQLPRRMKENAPRTHPMSLNVQSFSKISHPPKKKKKKKNDPRTHLRNYMYKTLAKSANSQEE
uniref:Uncharacterized protein n=1 Tax=Clytia hemisphaerica TaxID=252671 RepID=A0A7M5XMB5_9CNID